MLLLLRTNFLQKLSLARIRFFIKLFIQGGSRSSQGMVSLGIQFETIWDRIVELKTETWSLASTWSCVFNLVVTILVLNYDIGLRCKYQVYAGAWVIEYMCMFFYYLRESKLRSEKIKFWTFGTSYINWAPVFRCGIKITNCNSKEWIAT